MNEENERNLMMENEKVSLVQKIKWYIVKPSKFFEKFKENPKILIHLIIIVILSAVSATIIGLKTRELANETLEGLSADQIAMANNFTEVFSSPIFIFGTSVITVIITYLFFALFRYIFVKLFKGEVTYKEMFSLVVVTSYPVAIGGLIKSLFFKVTSDITMMDTILNKINIWSIWQLVLLIIGIKVLFNISMKKSVIINVGIFIVSTLFTVGIAMLNSNLSNMVQ